MTDTGEERNSGHIVRPVVRVASLGELRIYPISESELDRLAQGSPDSLFLNFALFFVSSGLTLLVTLLTTTIASNRLFEGFLTFCIISFITTAVLGAFWLRNRASSRALVREIKSRMPPPSGIQQLPPG